LAELVFLKLGGSLITDKRRYETPRPAVITRVAEEVAAALAARPDLHLVLGHGSGSFGHFQADKFRVREGDLQDWRGFAETSASAQRLNRMMTDALLSVGIGALPQRRARGVGYRSVGGGPAPWCCASRLW
jgi:isopentenyl phosphate kinase